MALFGTLAVAIVGDASKFNKTMDDAAKKSGSFGDKFAKTASSVGKAAVAGLATAGAAIVGLGTKAVKAYADYEQLVGGVETLFGKSAGAVQKYADNAYKTAGLSANEYMETVTSFSASLLQSLGGDTAAAAEVADMAISDMADNANKMGTSMEAIQNAYQGFAKQNYTMLDNLKLGYGGTKTEMERLLADAEKLTGIKYDISNLDDVYQAIHAVQVEMDITGTTALEASTTIQGSAASMKAAWQNMLVGISDKTQDFDVLLKNFIDSAGTFSDNLLPRINVTLGGVTKLIAGLTPQITRAIPSLVADVLPHVVDGATSLISSFIAMAPRLADTILGVFPTALKKLAQGLGDALPVVKPLTNALSLLADNFDDVLGVTVSATAAFATFKVAMAAGNKIEAFINSIKTASVAMKGAETATSAASAVLSVSTKLQGAFAAAALNSATAEAVASAAKKAGMTIDAAGNLITEAGTMATAKETAAVLASSGALSAKTVIAGLLTGKIGLATAAQWLWNTAVAANPIVAIIAGVAALTAGIVTLVKWINKDTQEQKALKYETEDLVEANKGLVGSIADSSKAYSEREKEITANVGASEKLADKVFELVEEEKRLAAQGEDTTSMRKQIAATVDAYNESMGDTILLYDEETSSMNKTREELGRLAKARLAEAKQQAANERAVEIAKEQMRAEEQLAATTKQRIELEERKAAGMDKTWLGGFKLQDQLDELTATEAELTVQIRGQEEALDAVTRTMAEAEMALDAMGDAQEETAARVKTAAELQNDILVEREAAEAEYTAYLQEQANLRGMTVDEFTEYLGKAVVEEKKHLDEAMLHYLEVRDEQDRIIKEKEAAETEYTNYLTEQANLRGMSLDEFTALLGENAVENMRIIDDEMNHAIEAKLTQEGILGERTAAEEAYTLSVIENANARRMTVEEFEQLQKDAAEKVAEANQRILSAYQTMTASLGNVNQEIQLDSKTTWSSVQKNQTDMIAKTEEFSSLYAQLIKAGVSESYLDAIGATGPESIPLLRSMITAGTDEVKSKEKEWEAAYGTIQDGLASALSDDKETQTAISDYISGNNGIGPSLKKELADALEAADFAGLAKAVPEGVGKGIVDNLTSATDETKNMGEEAGKSFKAAIKSNSPSELFAKIAESMPQGVVSGVSRMWHVVTTMLTKVVGQAKTTAISAVTSNDYPSVGENMVQGMINGITSKSSALYASIADMAKKAIQKAKNVLQINSPSKAFDEIGEMTGLGFIGGVKAMMKRAQEAVADLVAIPDISTTTVQADIDMQAAGLAIQPDPDALKIATSANTQSIQGRGEGGQNPIMIIVKAILDGHEVGFAATEYISQQQGSDLENALRAAGVVL